MLVVDTNIIAYLHIEGEFTKQAQALYERDSEWVAPRLWEYEFQNVLATCVRQKVLTPPQAQEAWQEASKRLSGSSYDVSADEALSCAMKHNITAYDAHFLTLAQILDIPLITQDKKLQSTSKKTVYFLKEFLRIPL